MGLPQRFVSGVAESLSGEKSGHVIGRVLSTAPKDAGILSNGFLAVVNGRPARPAFR